MPHKSFAAAAALAGLITLSACGSEPITDRSFDSVGDLREAATDAGLECGGDEIVQGEGYKESMSCGDNVWLIVFDDDQQKSRRVSQYDDNGSNFLQGANWVVVAPQNALDQIES